jgi:sugar/nucleoside kinase (ribokinase family)
MIDVVGVGGAVVDLLVNIPQVPKGNGGMRAQEMFQQGGGNCATAMAAAARLGARAGMIAKVGDDRTGDFIIKDFNYNGVDTSRIVRGPPGSSSSFVVAVSEMNPGTRFFIGRQSTVGRLEPNEIDYDYIAGAKILHIENGEAAPLAAAQFAREKGIAVTIDAGYYSQDRVDVIPYVDVCIASEMFHNGLFKGNEDDLEGNCRKIHEMGPSVVWVTRGPKGCVGLVDGKFIDMPAIDVPVIVDTVGAGDVFHGAYAAAMLEGLSHPECARYASGVSAIKCMYVGGRTGIPNRETLRRFLEDGALLTDELDERLNYYRREFMAR